MRILMVNKYHRIVGGVERHIEELTQLLESRGHEVIPFAMDDPLNDPSPYASYFVSGMELLDSDRRPRPWTVAERVIYSREARCKMAELVKATQPDVAHLHNVYHHISPSVIDALAEWQVPTLMTLHDYKLICPIYSFWLRGQICERCRSGHFYHCLLNRCNHSSLAASTLNMVEAYAHRLLHVYDRVNLYLAPSHFLKQKHVEHGFAPERILHVPNFVSGTRYVPRFDHGGYIVFAGRLTPFKGVGILLEAMAQLKATVPLVIAGDGPSRGDLETQALKLGLSTVEFVGHRPFSDLCRLIAGAMFVVVPSEWYENCPYAVLEALALGTPIVASATGGIPELIDDGVHGILVPPGDADALADGMHRMFEARLGAMARAARQRLEEHYSEDSHLRALSLAYQAIGLPSP